MKRMLGIAMLAATLLAGAAHAADDHVALIKNVSGKTRIARDDRIVDATRGMTLFASDRIVSGADGSAGIAFRDGTLLTVGPSTDIQLRDYAFEPETAKYAFSMYLAKGTAIYSSGKIARLAPGSVRIDTPTATVGVRGTRVIVAAE